MRLQEVLFICKKAYSSWPKPAFDEKKAAGGAAYYVLKNTDEIVSLLDALDVVPSFEDSIAEIRKTSVRFMHLTGQANFESGARNTFIKEFSLLENRVSAIVELLDSMDYTQTADGLDIKLPPHMSLSDLSKCAKDLDTIFTKCPLLTKAEGSISLSAVDVGSIWLSFAIVGAAAGILGIVAALVDKALVIRSHYLTTKEQEERYRGLKLGNDVLDNQKQINEAVAKGLLEKVTSELAAEHEISDPEDIGRIKLSIQLLSDWMGKGMEVYAAVQASPEVKAVFSPVAQQALPTETIKMLEGNTEEN